MLFIDKIELLSSSESKILELDSVCLLFEVTHENPCFLGSRAVHSFWVRYDGYWLFQLFKSSVEIENIVFYLRKQDTVSEYSHSHQFLLKNIQLHNGWIWILRLQSKRWNCGMLEGVRNTVEDAYLHPLPSQKLCLHFLKEKW